MKEETLSDKRVPTYGLNGKENNAKYWEGDVKEFIKKLKEEVNEFCPEGHGHYSNFIEIINNLAGDKLTKEQDQDG
jgi:hypothetical protein